MKTYLYSLLLCLLVTACGSPLEAAPTPAPTQASALLTETSSPVPSETATNPPTETVTASPTLGIGDSQVSPVDGMILMYVPAGTFQMGAEDGYRDERPVHEVELPAFWIDQTEVTNSKYALCEAAGACARPRRKSSNVIDLYYGGEPYADYPVIFISWQDAADYCTWAGRRLPSEAEWEKAARGTDGRPYPWGSAAPDASLLTFDHQQADPTRTGSHPAGASPYGVLDMAGNVSEWVADWYAGDYYALSPLFAPLGPESGEHRVVRGGSWKANAMGVRSAHRFIQLPDQPTFDLGFRCVLSALP